jgi:hypothetical protein
MKFTLKHFVFQLHMHARCIDMASPRSDAQDTAKDFVRIRIRTA